MITSVTPGKAFESSGFRKLFEALAGYLMR
jgi:hypothetical protein